MIDQIEPMNQVIVFNDYQIRRVLHENAWWFVILDIVFVLTESENPSDEISRSWIRKEIN
jgi:prophage antirepressor-like protein